MDPETAQRALTSRRKAGAVLARLRSAGSATLPRHEGLRGLLEGTYGHEPEHTRRDVIEQKIVDISQLVAGLPDADRSALIRTLLPGVAGSAEAAWHLLARRPYQTYLFRRPFRCPRSAETLVQIRSRWLLNTTLLLGDYEEDICWVAAWASHLASWWGGLDLGWLLAGAIDAGGETGDEVFEILRASGAGTHAIGRMGRHVTQALLSCGRPDAWAYVEKLLLSAGRQEGLRQAVLESVDEAHPQAFRRMLRVIRDEDLTRFSATVRAIDVWFGFLWDGASSIKADTVIDRVLHFLDDPAARSAALDEQDAEMVYLALWSTAFDDVDAAIPLAIRLLTDSAVERRFVATHFLAQTFWTDAMPPFVGALADDDLRVVERALDTFAGNPAIHISDPRLFEQLESVMARLARRSQRIPAIVWPWTGRKLERPQVARAMTGCAGSVAATRVLPYFRDLDAAGREGFLRHLAGLPPRWATADAAERGPLAPEIRQTVLDCLGDTSPEVRRAAFAALEGQPVRADEAARLVNLLGRTPGDLRSGCLERLRQLAEQDLLSAADSLLADAAEPRRLAGLELLRDAVESARQVAPARERIQRYAAGRPELSDAERLHVEATLDRGGDVATREDAMGLVDPKRRRTLDAPRPIPVTIDSAGAGASLDALAALMLALQEVEVTTRGGEKRLLVEALQYAGVPHEADQAAERLSEVPLAVSTSHNPGLC